VAGARAGACCWMSRSKRSRSGATMTRRLSRGSWAAAAAAGLLAGLGIAPLGIAAAAGLVALMAGALAFRIRVRDTIPFLLGDAAVLVLAAVTATLRALTA
jgi:hypothetical protein